MQANLIPEKPSAHDARKKLDIPADKLEAALVGWGHKDQGIVQTPPPVPTSREELQKAIVDPDVSRFQEKISTLSRRLVEDVIEETWRSPDEKLSAKKTIDGSIASARKVQ